MIQHLGIPSRLVVELGHLYARGSWVQVKCWTFQQVRDSTGSIRRRLRDLSVEIWPTWDDSHEVSVHLFCSLCVYSKDPFYFFFVSAIYNPSSTIFYCLHIHFSFKNSFLGIAMKSMLNIIINPCTSMKDNYFKK